MILLIDIGNTNTHLGLAECGKIRKTLDIPTAGWAAPDAEKALRRFFGTLRVEGAVLCSVVPSTTKSARAAVRSLCGCTTLELTHRAAPIHFKYPKPQTIGPDRLANAIAARERFGGPCIAVGFGTAAIFDVVDKQGNYIGGIIAPGIAAMADYLHNKTALLPKIALKPAKRAIGKSTEEALRAGVVLGYTGLVGHLLRELKRELRAPQVPVVATGGYAKLLAAGVPEITCVAPHLTLEGLLLVWQRHQRLIAADGIRSAVQNR